MVSVLLICALHIDSDGSYTGYRRPERTVFFARVWYWVDGTSYTYETFQRIINDGIQHFEALKKCIGSLNAASNPLARLQTSSQHIYKIDDEKP